MPYISNTDLERKQMLDEIGVEKFQDLIGNIPNRFLLKNLNIEEALSEMEITQKMYFLGKKNTNSAEANSFLGAGIYDHFIPAAVDHIVLRPEFHTAYTPYQAEVSQGTLQYIYEYQTMICDLTGMEIANASMYDGASAAAEAILMAIRQTRRYKALIAGSINPTFLKVIKAYTEGINVELVIVPEKNGVIDLDVLKHLMDDSIACLLIQTPNFLGNLEDMFEIEQIVHSVKKSLLITIVDPISLAILNSPAEYKADIVVGEGQELGNAQNYGGPLFGFFATTLKLARKMPGRIVGATLDADGKRAYCLTLQAREQHIRREKATSNICSNQSLCILAATVHLSLLGRKGLEHVAELSATKAHYLSEEICKIDGYEMAYNAPFFKEFVIKTPIPSQFIIDELVKKDIFSGFALNDFGNDDYLLIAVTEKKSKKQMDAFVCALKEVNHV